MKFQYLTQMLTFGRLFIVRVTSLRFGSLCHRISDDRLRIWMKIIGWIMETVNFRYYITVGGGLSNVPRENTHCSTMEERGISSQRRDNLQEQDFHAIRRHIFLLFILYSLSLYLTLCRREHQKSR